MVGSVKMLPIVPSAPGGRTMQTATSAPSEPCRTARDGWDFSTVPATAGRITRRYRFNDSLDRPLNKRLPKISHFDVRVAEHLTDATMSDPTGRFEVPSQRDYLRVYYSDFLSQPPVEAADRPRFVDSEETSIESEELQDWVLRVSKAAADARADSTPGTCPRSGLSCVA